MGHVTSLASLVEIDMPPLLAVTIAGAVLLLVLGIYGMLARRDSVALRLDQGTAAGTGTEPGNAMRAEGKERLKSIDRFLAPGDGTRRSRDWLRMQQAGWRGNSVIRVYYLTRALLGVGLAAVAAFGLPFLTDRLPPAACSAPPWRHVPWAFCCRICGWACGSSVAVKRCATAFPMRSTCCWSASRRGKRWTRRWVAWPKRSGAPIRCLPRSSGSSARAARRQGPARGAPRSCAPHLA